MLHLTQLIGFGVRRSGGVGAVNFDGSTYLTRGADLTGSAASKLWTFSLWVKRGSIGVLQRIFDTTSFKAELQFLANNELSLKGRTTGGVSILLVNTSAIADTTNWHHVMGSFDLSDTGKRHLYVDGVSDLTVSDYVNDLIDFPEPEHTVGTNGSVPGTFNYDGDMAELWNGHGVYIDLSVQANREKFRTADGKPANLGVTGEMPTGAAPLMFFSGATENWHTNKGTGGGFTENGTLTTASTSPSD